MEVTSRERSSTTDSSDDLDENLFAPYSREPEWTEEELAANMDVEEVHDEEESDDNLPESDNGTVWPPASRLENTDWCQCGECCTMPTREECICCGEYPEMLRKLSDSRMKCVSLINSFALVCLEKDVLGTALIGFLDLTKRPLDAPVDNRALRYAAYRQFTWWSHGRLGKSVRLAVPACVVKKIRDAFPCDLGGYTGFRADCSN